MAHAQILNLTEDGKLRTEAEIKNAINVYSDTVRRLCFVYLKNHADTEDIFQTVFIKYAYSDKVFENKEHEKAWIIRVTINQCKDLLKSFLRRNTVSMEAIDAIDTISQFQVSDEQSEVLQAVAALPKKYRVPIYLHYIEGYSAVEIGYMMQKNVNTIYTNLSRGRNMLKEILQGGEKDG